MFNTRGVRIIRGNDQVPAKRYACLLLYGSSPEVVVSSAVAGCWLEFRVKPPAPEVQRDSQKTGRNCFHKGRKCSSSQVLPLASLPPPRTKHQQTKTVLALCDLPFSLPFSSQLQGRDSGCRVGTRQVGRMISNILAEVWNDTAHGGPLSEMRAAGLVDPTLTDLLGRTFLRN